MTVFTGKPGNGKLLSDDTPVLTSAGWKSHGDLCVGDQVVGLDGRYKRVTAVFPKDFADMKITFSNGEVIQCHHNHEWVIEYHSGYAHKQRIMTAGKMFERFQANDGYRIGRNGKKSYRFKLPCRIPMEGTLKDLPVAPYT